MEQNKNARFAAPSPEALASSPASPFTLPGAERQPDLGPLISDCLADTFVEGGRKPRYDGWTAERIGGFLYTLAGCATVEAAAAAVGMSTASAYAFRNRRQGRAFAKMWDAILIHRSRVRIAADNASRAVNGVVSKRVRDGIVFEELHHHDNRLAMAMLTRLDRLAEREAPNEEHLRALSEDLDEYIECVESGGDPDAFVEAASRRPTRSPPAGLAPNLSGETSSTSWPRSAAAPPGATCRRSRFRSPTSTTRRRARWTEDQWIRAQRSGFLAW